MTIVAAICVGVIVAVSIYLLLGQELKGIAMGVFLLGHAANLSILAMSKSPVKFDHGESSIKAPPLLTDEHLHPGHALETIVDPLPQALILTAIVIGFAVMGFLLTLIVSAGRQTGTLHTADLSKIQSDDDVIPAPQAGGAV